MLGHGGRSVSLISFLTVQVMPPLYLECRSDCINTICDLAQRLHIRVRACILCYRSVQINQQTII